MELAGLGCLQPYATLCYMSKGAYISHTQLLLGSAIRSLSTSSMILFAACRCRLLGLVSLLLRLSDYGDDARTRNFQLGKLNFRSFIFNTYQTLRKKRTVTLLMSLATFAKSLPN